MPETENRSFFEELKRRNVYRVAVAYAIVFWLLLQLVDIVLPIIGLPDWAPKLVLTMLLVGFPIALIFAWAFELTPEGLKREKEVDRSQSITGNTGHKLDRMIIGVLVVAIGLLLADKFLLTDAPVDAEKVAEEVVAEEVVVEPDVMPSIAVLPFTNMSADESSGYFSDGLADTLLHMLAQIGEIRVAARTSSFQFRDQSVDISEIGSQLNVSTVLEGSVQRSGDKIRVTAQLIDVSNGFHLWSGNFDRDLDNVFAIQDEIANEVVKALKVSLLGDSVEELGSDQTDNFDAYTKYLLAINDLEYATVESLNRAVNSLQGAIRLDPEYARAYATLGRTYLFMNDYGVMNLDQSTAAARNMASTALELSEDSSEALAVLGLAELLNGNLDIAGQWLRRATEVGPNDATALAAYGRYLMRDAQPAEAIEVLRKLQRLNPLSETGYFQLAAAYAIVGQHEAANETAEALLTIRPNAPNSYAAKTYVQAKQGKWAAAAATIQRIIELDPDDPEGPGLLGQFYLFMEMPDEASRMFDRAIEVDMEHPVSRMAPLLRNYYSQQNEAENVRLAQKLLSDGVDDRRGARTVAFVVLADSAAKTGRHDIVLEALDNLYPHLFDDPPRDLDVDFSSTYFAGQALLASGQNRRKIIRRNHTIY